MTATRRSLLGTGLALAAAGPAAARWEDVTRYPDPAFEILDPSFARYRLDAGGVERLYTGARWSEGPVWMPAGRYLLWSDIPNDRMLRWHETTGQVDEYRKPAGFTNGLARDRQGRLIACEHGGRRVTRTEHDGSITVICDRFDGKRLNSPNDVAVTSDGAVWFTDPPFGILGLYEGYKGEQELPTNIYRVDGQTGEVTLVSGEVKRPNGLAFSPDEHYLYVDNWDLTHKVLMRYEVNADGTIGNGKVFYDFTRDPEPVALDGIKVDVQGNVYVSAPGGVWILSPTGKALGRIVPPEHDANFTFGDADGRSLYLTASTGLYRVRLNVPGIRPLSTQQAAAR
jgi:gluconolactonase